MKKKLVVLLSMLLCLTLCLPCVASADRYRMTSRGIGPCVALRGNVKLVTIFVNTPRSGWTSDMIDHFYTGFWSNTREIEQQAASYGTYLSISAAWGTITTTKNVCDYGDPNFNIDWYWDILGQYGFSSMQQMHDAWVDDCDDVAILFLFDEEGRCYSYESDADSAWREEFPVYFTRSFPNGKIDHELYHLFGAIDLYAPDGVYQAAKKYLKESLMMGGTIRMDSFNAYLLGWTDVLDEPASAFREAIRWVE